MVEGQDLVPTRLPALTLAAEARGRKFLDGDRRVYLTALKLAKDVGGVFLGPLFAGGVTLLEHFADAADDAELEANFEDLRDLNTRTDEKLTRLRHSPAHPAAAGRNRQAAGPAGHAPCAPDRRDC